MQIISDKGLISRTHKEQLKFNKKPKNTTQKWAKNLNSLLSKEDVKWPILVDIKNGQTEKQNSGDQRLGKGEHSEVLFDKHRVSVWVTESSRHGQW